MVDVREVEAKRKELQENLQQRAETLVANDPICAEIRGNIASLSWVVGDDNAESTEE